MTLKEDKDEFDKIKKEMERLEPMRAKYYELSHKAEKLYREIQRVEQQGQLGRLKAETGYQSPIFPEMGVAAENGSATFESKKQAEQLCDLLTTGYYYHFTIEWSGMGDYIAVPSYHHDHDNEVINTCTFRLP